mmetsp:Transcript_28581/g.52169  ORF Transcript_28581/g.52169 Transcript_28581/m.52169 type:complete len:250 (-) Transcript_28581:134-883(-)|eukprot:CAMPEP_0196132522 /NCGR_PEP_ID=MMETSP0910-20130528/2110_1 /TAXON_ID=49265 /ORGANISM="Thalassiosira rotula, Strain GSO102" /LENGTH=249 /DNA_ID=CAMNT_0041392139 /DNA_START=136 /DNA_END=885 /DNA_ORIENTATION=-
MPSWLTLSFTGSNEIFSPLLPNDNDDDNDDDDPAANDDADTIDTTESLSIMEDDAQDPITAAAIRAITQHQHRRSEASNIDAARQRRHRLTQIQSHLRSVTRRVSDMSVASVNITHQMEHFGSQYNSEATTTGYYGVRLMTTDDGEDDEGRSEHRHHEGDTRGDEKVPPDVMTAAFIMTLLATAGVATYLATFWDTLQPVVKCFVPITFLWLVLAMISIVIQCFNSGEQQREEEPVRSQSQIVAETFFF